MARLPLPPLAMSVDAAVRALIFLASILVLTGPFSLSSRAEPWRRTASLGAIVALVTIAPVLAIMGAWRATPVLLAGSMVIAAAAEEIVFRERLPRAIVASLRGHELWAMLIGQMAFALAHLAARVHVGGASDLRDVLRLTAAGCLLMWFRIAAGLPSAVAVHAACNLSALRVSA